MHPLAEAQARLELATDLTLRLRRGPVTGPRGSEPADPARLLLASGRRRVVLTATDLRDEDDPARQYALVTPSGVHVNPNTIGELY